MKICPKKIPQAVSPYPSCRQESIGCERNKIWRSLVCPCFLLWMQQFQEQLSQPSTSEPPTVSRSLPLRTHLRLWSTNHPDNQVLIKHRRLIVLLQLQMKMKQFKRSENVQSLFAGYATRVNERLVRNRLAFALIVGASMKSSPDSH